MDHKEENEPRMEMLNAEIKTEQDLLNELDDLQLAGHRLADPNSASIENQQENDLASVKRDFNTQEGEDRTIIKSLALPDGDRLSTMDSMKIVISDLLRQDRELAEQRERDWTARFESLCEASHAQTIQIIQLSDIIEQLKVDLKAERENAKSPSQRLDAKKSSNSEIATSLKSGDNRTPTVPSKSPNSQIETKNHEIYETVSFSPKEISDLIHGLTNAPAQGAAFWSTWKLKHHRVDAVEQMLAEDPYFANVDPELRSKFHLAEGYKFEIVLEALKFAFSHRIYFFTLQEVVNSFFNSKPFLAWRDYSGALSYLKQNYLMINLRPNPGLAIEPWLVQMRRLLPWTMTDERQVSIAIKQLWPSPLKAFLLSEWSSMISKTHTVNIWTAIKQNVALWNDYFSSADRRKFVKEYFKSDAQLRTEMEMQLMEEEIEFIDQRERERLAVEEEAAQRQAQIEAELVKVLAEETKTEAKRSAYYVADSTASSANGNTSGQRRGKKKRIR